MGVLVRKLSQLTRSAKLSGQTPGISYCTVESAVSYPAVYTALFGLRVRDSRLTSNDNLSRRLQPGYNYVGQTNDRQPLHISAVGRLRDYLPNS